MRVLVFEENLLWGPRLLLTCRAHGHDAELARTDTPLSSDWQVAIVNLSSTVFPPAEWVPRLRAAGIVVVAHAGHKERELLEAARGLECEYVATNSEITNKLPQILQKFSEPSQKPDVDPNG
jgi:hypothetical protein